MENLLSMRGASRRISNDFALQNVDLTVKENEVVGFVGLQRRWQDNDYQGGFGLGCALIRAT